jgi:hypothetical protein
MRTTSPRHARRLVSLALRCGGCHSTKLNACARGEGAGSGAKHGKHQQAEHGHCVSRHQNRQTHDFPPSIALENVASPVTSALPKVNMQQPTGRKAARNAQPACDSYTDRQLI